MAARSAVPAMFIVLGVGLVALLLTVPRISGWTAPGRRPRKRHLVTRIICGTLGLLILGAVGVGTWRELRRSYEPGEETAALTVRVPTMPVPPPPEPMPDDPEMALSNARWLFHGVVAEVWPGQFRPVYVGEHEVKWPQDKGRTFTSPFQLDGAEGEFVLRIDRIQVGRLAQAGQRLLNYESDLRLSWRGAGGSGGSTRSGTGLAGREVVYLGGVGRPGAPTPSPWSAVARPPSTLAAFAFLTRLAEDDPLREVPAGDLVPDAGEMQRSKEDAMRTVIARQGSGQPWGGPRLPHGLALVMHVGTSSLLLLLAAVFLAQLFRRRSLAFAGVLAVVILYAAALDRVVLGAHLGRLDDAKAPAETRLTACAGAASTFFFRRTASAALERLADDGNAPAALQEAAGRVRDYLGPADGAARPRSASSPLNNRTQRFPPQAAGELRPVRAQAAGLRMTSPASSGLLQHVMLSEPASERSIYRFFNGLLASDHRHVPTPGERRGAVMRTTPGCAGRFGPA